MDRWKRNIAIICLAQLLTLVGFSAYQPFIPYYIMDLGARTYEDAARWQALFESLSGLGMMIASPIWGGLADRYGRKMMLMRATLFGSMFAFMMGMVHSPGQLVALRALQGVFCGSTSAAMVMIATQTPDEHLGVALGLMQTVQYIAQASGPLVGGTLGDFLSYRSVFPISAGMIAAGFVLVWLFAQERFTPPVKELSTAHGPAGKRRMEKLRQVLTRNAMLMLFTLGAIRLAMAIESPIVSLYVKSMAPDHPRIATLAGTVISASSVSTAIAAMAIGRLADRVGQKKVLVICTLGIAVMQVPQAFATTPTQLIILRAIQGVFTGGTAPTANALLARSTPSERRGALFGLSNSVQSGGRAIGPGIGAAVASASGMPSVFLVAAGVLGGIAAIAGAFVKLPKAVPVGQAAGVKASTTAPPA